MIHGNPTLSSDRGWERWKPASHRVIVNAILMDRVTNVFTLFPWKFCSTLGHDLSSPVARQPFSDKPSVKVQLSVALQQITPKLGDPQCWEITMLKTIISVLQYEVLCEQTRAGGVRTTLRTIHYMAVSEYQLSSETCGICTGEPTVSMRPSVSHRRVF